jgi:hypothetical protein
VLVVDVTTYSIPTVLLCGFAEILPLTDKEMAKYDSKHENENKTTEDRRREQASKQGGEMGAVGEVVKNAERDEELRMLAQMLADNDESHSETVEVTSKTRVMSGLIPMLGRRKKKQGDDNSEQSVCSDLTCLYDMI